MRFEHKFLECLSLGPPLAANRSQKRSGSYYPGSLTTRKLAGQKSASGKLLSLVQIVGHFHEKAGAVNIFLVDC